MARANTEALEAAYENLQQLWEAMAHEQCARNSPWMEAFAVRQVEAARRMAEASRRMAEAARLMAEAARRVADTVGKTGV